VAHDAWASAGQTGIVQCDPGHLTLSERAQVLGTGDTVIKSIPPGWEYALGGGYLRVGDYLAGHAPKGEASKAEHRPAVGLQ